MKITTYDIIEPLKKLIEAKELLDEVLSYYDVYSGQFREVPDYECGFRGGPCPTLQDKIRNYIKFDDSE